jgi:hypothetical protein
MVRKQGEESLNDRSFFIDIPLNSYQHNIVIKELNGIKYIWDVVRKKWLKLKQEEFVRQIFIHFLSDFFPVGRIAVEKNAGLKQKKRIDIAVLDEKLNVFLLVELKEPLSPLSIDVILQAGVYQQQLQSKYLLISNGHEHVMWEFEKEKEPTLLTEWPF